jgi:hypothetical protein
MPETVHVRHVFSAGSSHHARGGVVEGKSQSLDVQAHSICRLLNSEAMMPECFNVAGFSLHVKWYGLLLVTYH